MHTRLIAAASAAALALSLTLSGCASMDETQKGTAQGAAIGAVTGAVLGAAVDSKHRGQAAGVGAAIGATAGAIAGNVWSKKMQEQKRALEQAAQGTGVQVSQTQNNELKLDIPSDISFDTGRYDIKPEMRPLLDKFAQQLRDYPVTNVRIVGHTDSTGSDAINEPLSQNRAAAARTYLVDRGVAGNRIATDGRGSHQPIADNATAEGRARNRRIEIFVVEPEMAQGAAPAGGR